MTCTRILRIADSPYAASHLLFSTLTLTYSLFRFMGDVLNASCSFCLYSWSVRLWCSVFMAGSSFVVNFLNATSPFANSSHICTFSLHSITLSSLRHSCSGCAVNPFKILIAFLNDRDRGLPLMHVVREVLLHVVVFTVEIPVRSQDPPRTPWRRPSWNSTCRRPSISVPITVLAPLGRKSRSPWSVLALVEGEGSWVAGGAVECAREDLSDWQKYSSGSVER